MVSTLNRISKISIFVKDVPYTLVQINHLICERMQQ